MIRKLGIFERAMLITNEHAPFVIVSVLKLENAPQPDILQKALENLQKRHPLLRSHIVNGGFEALHLLKTPFTTIERTHADQWRDIAEIEMAYNFDHTAESLFRATYLYSAPYGDLVLTIHHAITDALSGINLLDETLHLCSGNVADLPPLELAPAMEARFPFPFRGLFRGIATMKYAFSQMVDMLSYQVKNHGKRTPPVLLRGTGHTSSLILPEELVDLLSNKGRKASVTLNSIFQSALLLATNRHLYEGRPVAMRTFTFADLRPFTSPPTPSENLASYMSLLGITIEVNGNQDFWELAKTLQAKIYHMLKSGEKFSAVLMSEMLLKIITRTKFMRFGSTALSYSGVARLKKHYGDIKVVGLHGFVSGYDLGPEMASQARLFNDQVWWDFIYMDTDMDAQLARKIINEIKSILENAIR